MHRPDSRSPQVNALFWFRLGCEIPSISTVYAQAWRRCAQVIHMFVHRRQGSGPLTGGQAAADRHGRRSLQAWPARRVRVSGTRWSYRPPLAGRAGVRAAGLSSSAGGARSRVRPRPRRSRHDQGVGPPETTIRCRWPPNSMPFYRLVWAFLCRLGQNLDMCDAGQQPIVGYL